MAKNTKQHFVPQCYTKAWCDPSAPKTATSDPFVWTFDKDGSNVKKRSPANLFTESDMYTVPAADGGRDLYLEHGLGKLEDLFTRVRNKRFNKGAWPPNEEWVSVMMFVSTARIRTQAFRDFQRQQWKGMRERMEEMQATIDELNAQGKKANFGTPLRGSTSGRGMGLKDVQQLEQFPIQMMIGSTTKTVVKMFMNMNIAVLCTTDPIGFVTTDEPCTWFNPQGYKLPPFYRNPGLGMKDIEVTFPISPRQCLLITHNNGTGYFDVPIEIVHELNHRHIGHANEKFISSKPDLISIWFERPPMPEDSWENERARKIASGEIKEL